jgi:CMP-N-acetylneuraminic acid synthetase
MTKVFAVIPARGGSKGIPKKNIYPLCKKPLISYTIESAIKSKEIHHLIVSTDSYEIAEVARSYSVDVPFIRPQALSSDTALAVDVIKHAITHEEKRLQIRFDYVVMLQPTTPLKLTEDIDGAIQKLIQTGCESIVTMVDVGANHPARMYKIDNDKLVAVMDEGIAMRPRQELPPIYIRNGAVYAFRREVIDKYNALLGNDVRPYVMPIERSVNIDSHIDLYLAEYLTCVSK